MSYFSAALGVFTIAVRLSKYIRNIFSSMPCFSACCNPTPNLSPEREGDMIVVFSIHCQDLGTE